MTRIVWLTGASTGIGRATALRLAADGWRIAASARSVDGLAQLAADAAPGIIHPYPLDVTDHAACLACAPRIEREMGPIALAILNAGTHERMPAAEFSSALVRRLVDINLMGVVHGIESVLPAMLARGRGRLMLVASLAGYRGLPNAGPYGATKAALINLAEALRPDLLSKGIVVQLVNPGFVKTPLTDKNDFEMPFLIPVEQAVDAIVHGLDGTRFEITFPWAFAMLLKLGRLLPYPLYFRLTRRLVQP
jgi:NAD(P)-dependent dehydrogenase (short-subunit alcohol dehydrogenase family)